MELEIFVKNLELTEAIEAYVRKKVGKLGRYLGNITEAKVEISEEKTRSPQHRFTVQVTLNSKGTLLRSEEKSESVYAAIDAVTEVLTRQIERYKGKLYKKGRGVSLARQNSTLKEAIVDTETDISPKVVRVKRFPLKPMSVIEAAEQMELLDHDFLLFLNVDNDTLNLLYRREDGDYGLIEPQLA